MKDLHTKGFLSFRVLAADGSFLPACHWDKDATWGYVRRKGERALPTGCYVEQDRKILGLGYRVHVLVDADAQAPLSVVVTRANVNDATAWPRLYETSKNCVDWTRVGFFTADKGYDNAEVRQTFATLQVETVIPASNTPRDLRAGGFNGTRARVYRKRTSVERFFSMLKRFFNLHRWGITGLARSRKWILLACIACLIIAWTNHKAGRPTRSVKSFLRALR